MTGASRTPANDDGGTGTNPFLLLLDGVRRNVDARLATLFETKLATSGPFGTDVVAMVGAVRELTMRGGKRLRPALLMAAYLAVDPRAAETIAIRAGAALELLQTYLLVHDDWMDQDDLRRGGPAVHVMLARHHGSRRTGASAAVLAGDYAAALALETLALVNAPADRIARTLAMFAHVQQDVICGQQLDLGARPRDIEAMHDLKSGSYTVRGPVLIGATLAGADTRVLMGLEHFANPLGVAFQLRDDLLGAFGDPEKTGKPAGSDIRSGKHTALWVEALALAKPADKRTLRATVGRRTATEKNIRAVVDIFERSGARATVERRIDELARKARAALGTLGLAERGSECLAGAIATLTSRRR